MSISNPILRHFDAGEAGQGGSSACVNSVKLQGVTAKSIFLLLVLLGVASATSVWFSAWIPMYYGHIEYVPVLRIFTGAFFGGIGVAVVTVFRKRIAPYTAPLFAVIEGVALGLASTAANYRYPGIVMQAIGLTVAMSSCLLISYSTGWITPGVLFRKRISIAIGGAVVYCVGSLLLSLAGIRGVPMITGGVPGAVVSVVVVALPGIALVASLDAAVQLVKEGESKYHKYMEWYAALGIIVSLVWMYYEMLDVLSQARGNP